MSDTKVVDARNTFCPGPLMELISFMKRAEVGDQLELLFPGGKGTRYVVQTSDDMKTWVTLTKLIIGQGNTISERLSISGGLGFYRIQKD